MNVARVRYAQESIPLIEHGRTKQQQHGIQPDPQSVQFTTGWLLRLVILIVATLMVAIVVATGLVASGAHGLRWSTPTASQEGRIPQNCEVSPHCFRKSNVTVREDQPGFPSFWNYAHSGPISVSYDKRSILLNGERALFLSGSMHPLRLTPATWSAGLDAAVRHGLNMITVYIFWGAHQPFPDMEFDWSLPGGNWDVASAIRAAGNRGLFVHVRIGPYVCAEYNYGGIPEWVPLHKPEMSMRRPNKLWMDAMELFVNATVRYISDAQLWANQGGNIVMGQIENELGDDEIDETDQPILISANDGSNSTRLANMEDYANWCGEVASRAAPDVLWTMCNGLTARNAINTCNGYGGVGCASGWLEKNGQSGRIQVDQPALWTENEGGFQIWGETPTEPSNYFWGRTARDMARDGLRWFARGGSHLNYYMWLGGYNRGRSAASGIMNVYASDAIMCSSGQPRYPKYVHLQELHKSIANVASVLLQSSSALNHSRPLPRLDPNGTWVEGKDQRMFVYASGLATEVLFAENDADEPVTVDIPFSSEKHVRYFRMEALSAVLFLNGMVLFNSGTVNPRSMSFRRHIRHHAVKLLDWSSWAEPVGARQDDPVAVTDEKPREQTDLMISSRSSTDFSWYETEFYLDSDLRNVSISIDTQKSSAMSVFVDGVGHGSANDHSHAEGNITLTTSIGNLTAGLHVLSILSESLGYFNLIGRWGASTKQKPKGITGDVVLTGSLVGPGSVDYFEIILAGRNWRSRSGLHYEPAVHLPLLEKTRQGEQSVCLWYSTLFETPRFDPSDQALFLDIPVGRGRLWMNGHDLGRFWNLTRKNTDEYSQRYYFLPADMLYSDGTLNKLVLFNVEDGNLPKDMQLILSWTTASNKPTMKDIVDYPTACI